MLLLLPEVSLKFIFRIPATPEDMRNIHKDCLHIKFTVREDHDGSITFSPIDHPFTIPLRTIINDPIGFLRLKLSAYISERDAWIIGYEIAYYYDRVDTYSHPRFLITLEMEIALRVEPRSGKYIPLYYAFDSHLYERDKSTEINKDIEPFTLRFSSISASQDALESQKNQ